MAATNPTNVKPVGSTVSDDDAAWGGWHGWGWDAAADTR